MSQDVLLTEQNHLGFITLNRASALNALNHEMIKSMHTALNQWENDPTIHAVVVQSNSDRAFCAGGDVRAVYLAGKADPLVPMAFFHDEYHLNYKIHCFKKPYIALMNGLTFGGGVGISLHGSHPIATERFVFAMPETTIGFFPDIGASYLLTRAAPPAYGTYLGLTGCHIGVHAAFRLGFIHRTIPEACMSEFVEQLQETNLSEHAHATVDACLASFQEPLPADLPHLTLPDENAVKACFQHDSIDAIFKALEASESTWAKETRALLSQKSPSSLQVTLAQLHRMLGKSLNECLNMDYNLTYHFLQHTDFYEGVRARIIDKDNKPQWAPLHLSGHEIDNYFMKTGLDLPAR